MPRHDVVVIGGGISGASFAFHAARSGRRVVVVEREQLPGGSLHSERTPSGFWYELGAHTCYNSYGALLEVLEGCNLLDDLQPRDKSVLRFLDGPRVLPGKNLGLLLSLFRKGELLRAVPRWMGAAPAGQSVRSHYSRLVGPGNYERVLGPMLSAVPSQPAHDFPADMLFKKRPRRRDVLRSFTLPGGLRSAVEAILRQPRVDALLGRSVVRLAREREGFALELDDGSLLEADVVALALPPGATAKLLGNLAPKLAEHAASIREVQVQSLGFTVRADRVELPYATFLIPLGDTFHSVVTRDVVPDRDRRAFTMHFRPDQTRAERVARATEVLGVREEDMEDLTERRATLPSPVLGHAQVVAAIDRELTGERFAVTGNWFAGLSIEDCVQRSRAEWQRLVPD
jgi:UDP-galactopyranose mutase